MAFRYDEDVPTAIASVGDGAGMGGSVSTSPSDLPPEQNMLSRALMALRRLADPGPEPVRQSPQEQFAHMSDEELARITGGGAAGAENFRRQRAAGTARFEGARSAAELGPRYTEPSFGGGQTFAGVPAPTPQLLEESRPEPSYTDIPQSDPDSAMRALGASLRAPEDFGYGAQGVGGRVFVGDASKLRGGFEEGGRRFGGTLEPGDITAAERRGAVAGEAAGNTDALLAKKAQLLDYLSVAPSQANQEATIRQLGIIEAQLGTAAKREGRGLERAKTERALGEVGTAPGAREIFDVERGLKGREIEAGIEKAQLTGPATAGITAAGGIERERVQQEGAMAIKELESRFKMAGYDKDQSLAYAKSIGDFALTMSPEDRKQFTDLALSHLSKTSGKRTGDTGTEARQTQLTNTFKSKSKGVPPKKGESMTSSSGRVVTFDGTKWS